MSSAHLDRRYWHRKCAPRSPKLACPHLVTYCFFHGLYWSYGNGLIMLKTAPRGSKTITVYSEYGSDALHSKRNSLGPVITFDQNILIKRYASIDLRKQTNCGKQTTTGGEEYLAEYIREGKRRSARLHRPKSKDFILSYRIVESDAGYGTP